MMHMNRFKDKVVLVTGGNRTTGLWLRHYVGTLTNVRPPDSVKYFHL